jgi:hypothetical protein
MRFMIEQQRVCKMLPAYSLLKPQAQRNDWPKPIVAVMCSGGIELISCTPREL